MSFVGDWWRCQRPTLDVVGQMVAIAELKGRAELYSKQTPQALETLRQVALIQSTESSNRIEGIEVSGERLLALMKTKTAPLNRSEAEIAGYRKALDQIHAAASDLPLSPHTIRALHQLLFALTDRPGGEWKRGDNLIVDRLPDGRTLTRFTPVPALETPQAMEQLCVEYQRQEGLRRVPPLLLIPTFVLDFLCIHPFTDGNGRIARLLTLLLLYQQEFNVGRFISLEKIIEDSKETYYESLQRSSIGWHEGRHDPNPWWSYWLGTVLVAYRQFEERAGTIQQRRGGKTEMILSAIANSPGEFTIQDLQERAPTASKELIRHVLQQERSAGRVACSGRGRDAHWKRTVRTTD